MRQQQVPFVDVEIVGDAPQVVRRRQTVAGDIAIELLAHDSNFARDLRHTFVVGTQGSQIF